MRTRGGTRGEPMARPFLLRRPRESGGADLRIVCYSPLSTLYVPFTSSHIVTSHACDMRESTSTVGFSLPSSKRDT